MYKHILVGSDGSDLAGLALDHGIAMAKALGAKLTVVTVTEPWTAVAAGTIGVSFPFEDYEKGTAAFAEGVLTAARKKAADKGIEAHTIHMSNQFPAEGILETAKVKDCDLIVVASHGRKGLSRLILGGETYRLVNESPIPVLVIRQAAET